MLKPSHNFVKRLLQWYEANRRDLPWRLPLDTRSGASPQKLDPYHVLVSEAMLQQTQVATVIPYFLRFLERFPTVKTLAEADEQEVLRLWQGLGYYSRARNLQRAAKAIVSEHGGRVPRTVEELLNLPGVGRYTAGAVASIAYDVKAPILDGNVARVLCRIDRIESDPREKDTQALLWRRAEEILPDRRVGDFNSALMELGATVCIPRTPQCLACPVRQHCEAFAGNVQDRIPAPKKAKPTPLLRRDVFCIRQACNGLGERWLIEQRPATGRWAGMWQFVTIEANGSAPTKRSVRSAASVGTSAPAHIGTATHGLTHRRYHFDVYRCDCDLAGVAEAAEDTGGANPAAGTRPRRWVTAAELDQYPLPRPHLKIAAMLGLLPPKP